MHLPFVSRRHHLRTLDAAVQATTDFANLLLRAERERANHAERRAGLSGAALNRARDRAEQAEVRLAGVLIAAEGGTSPEVVVKKGDYGWSLAYERVLELRQAFDLLAGREHGIGLDPASVLAGGKLPKTGPVLAVTTREQIDHNEPGMPWVAHESYSTRDCVGTRRVAYGTTEEDCRIRAFANMCRWPAPADVPHEAQVGRGAPPAHLAGISPTMWTATFTPSEVTFLRNVVRQRAWPRSGDESVIAGIARKIGIEVPS